MHILSVLLESVSLPMALDVFMTKSSELVESNRGLLAFLDDYFDTMQSMILTNKYSNLLVHMYNSLLARTDMRFEFCYIDTTGIKEHVHEPD